MGKKLNLVFILLIALFLISCNSSNEKINKNKKIVVAQEGEPRSLDPHKGNDGYSLKINRQIYSRLVEMDEDMNIQPSLAKNWIRIDDRTMDFVIRDDVKFHNGDLLTVEDIKYSIERMVNSPRISFVVPPIEKVEILDDNIIRIVTKEPFGPLLQHLAHPALGIVNKKINQDEKDFKIIGTGAFKFKEWKSGEFVILEQNKDYFLEQPKIETLVFRNIVEASNRSIGLETGELDISLGINPIDVRIIEGNKNLKIITKNSNSLTYLGMNNKKAPYNDIRVRRAINYAIDKEAIINTVIRGYGKAATSPISSGVIGFTDKTKNYSYNLEEGKKLMLEAGLEKGFQGKLYTTGGEIEKQTAEIIQSNLREIGIDIKIEILEASTYFELTSRGEHDLYLASWGTVTSDADYGLYSLFHSSAQGAAGNRDFYSNKEVDDLLDEGRTTINQEKRNEIYEKAQIKIVEDSPNVMLYNRILLVGSKKNIKGLELNPVTLHNFYPVYIQE